MKRVVPMMGGYYDAGWGSWVVMSVMMVGLWVLVAVAIVAVMRWPWGARDRTAPEAGNGAVPRSGGTCLRRREPCSSNASLQVTSTRPSSGPGSLP